MRNQVLGGRRHGWKLVLYGAVIAAVGLLVLPKFRHSPPAQTRPPNIVLVTVDTLRADALGCYGSATPTPAIDRLAREGLIFVNAACPMPLTRPSHFSLMTSRYPRQHGVVNNRLSLAPETDTLAEILSRAGYDTAGFVAVKLLDESSGAAQGFDAFVAPRSSPFIDADVAVPPAIDWLQQRTTPRPFFLWLHVFDPHMPYKPPVVYRPKASEGSLGEASWETLVSAAVAADGHLSAAVLDEALGLYAGEVRFVDAWVGRLVQTLEARNLLDDTVVALTADHGECFGNGIYFEHSDCLYDGAIRVPLIVRYPGTIQAGRRETRQVDLLDVAPTLLQLARVAPPATFQGRSLLAFAQDEREAAAFFEHPLYQQGAAENRPRRVSNLQSVAGDPVRPVVVDHLQMGLRTSEWKLIASPEGDEVYDLRRDSRELHNLVAARTEVHRALRTELDRWLTGHPLEVRDEGSINPGLRETLRALGYIQ